MEEGWITPPPFQLAERAGLEPAQAFRPAALPTRCHTIRRPLRMANLSTAEAT